MKRALSLALASWLVAGPLLAETVRVTASAANVRSGPSTASRIVGWAPHGTLLEVLEKSGDWRKVRSAEAGIEGWIHGRLLEPVAAPVAAAPVAEAKLPTAGLSIEHKDVGCLLAGRYTKLEACVGPAEAVGRAQVQFRAAGTGPWYAVDMAPEGSCLATWLPKPKAETTSVEYFVWAADKSFAESARPEKAPGAAFTPRVVRKKSECDSLKALLAFAAKQAPRIVVHAVRDAAGKVLEAAASQGLEAAGGIAGFSPDGVVMASTGAAPGQPSASSGGAGSGAAAAGHSVKTLAIVGGAVAVGGIVAIAAGGGGGSSSGSSTPTTQAPPSLSGSWGGTASSGAGLSLQIFVTGGNCTYRWDIDANLVQSGNSLAGPASAVRRSITCNPSSPELERIIAPLVPATETFSLNATLSPPSGISIPIGDQLLTGSYTATTIQAKGSQATPDHTSDYVLSLTKR